MTTEADCPGEKPSENLGVKGSSVFPSVTGWTKRMEGARVSVLALLKVFVVRRLHRTGLGPVGQEGAAHRLIFFHFGFLCHS